MSDDTLDSGSVLEGTPASPNAGGSQGENVSGGSGAGQPQTDFEALSNQMREMQKQLRSLQGDKDRGIAQTKKEVDDLKRKFTEIEKLKSKGFSEDEAFEELEIRDAIRELRSQMKPNNSVQPSPAGNGNGLAVEKAETLKKYGLNENDPDVAKALSDVDSNNPLALENAALRVAFNRTQKPTPDASAASSVTNTPTQRETDTPTLINKLSEMQKHPSKYRDEIQKLSKQLDERGWK